YKDIPYQLIERTMHKYFTEENRVMAIYTAAGCPYKCAFCISPVWYKSNVRKWVPFETDYVIGHMEYLIKKYDINFFYLYDDDSFVKVSHFMDIAREIKRRGFKVKIGVRGIRVNELDRITDEEFKLLEDVGITTIHVGVESGSQRMLDLMKKGIKVERSIAVNRRLAVFPNITPIYNLLVGFPTETVDDLKKTKKLMVQLAEDNPRCILVGPQKFIPYPGSELYELAVKYGFKPPQDMEDWASLDQEKEIWMPWYTKEYNDYIKMLYVEQNILDNRFNVLPNLNMALKMLLKLIRWLYMPIGKLRLRYDFTKFLIEYRLMKLFFKI
ncbi:MAG: radical SAM protein, partial [Candidatus Subteraquimicrobiales bacterium]|nr:radical SAM protein [Candidatus Subteraquimicrobiales bacterium]